jgi:hypothetical protein
MLIALCLRVRRQPPHAKAVEGADARNIEGHLYWREQPDLWAGHIARRHIRRGDAKIEALCEVDHLDVIRPAPHTQVWHRSGGCAAGEKFDTTLRIGHPRNDSGREATEDGTHELAMPRPAVTSQVSATDYNTATSTIHRFLKARQGRERQARTSIRIHEEKPFATGNVGTSSKGCAFAAIQTRA